MSIDIKKILRSGRAASSFRHGNVAVCGVVIWPHRTPRTTHSKYRKLPRSLENHLAPAKSTVSVRAASHAASISKDVPQNVFPELHVSPYDLVFPRHGRPPVLEALKHCHRQFSSCGRQWLCVSADRVCCCDGGRCQTLCYRCRTLCVDCAVAGRGVLIELLSPVAGGYVSLKYKMCELFLPYPVHGQTSMSPSK